MVEYLKNPNFWVSVISVIIAIFALVQSSNQVRLSNKQSLFDRRLEKYLIAKDLLNLFGKNREHIVGDDKLHNNTVYEFELLVNTSYLCDMNRAVKSPLNKEEQNVFLTKCEMLEKYAIEISVLWDNESGKVFGEFLNAYKNVLYKMYQQQICVEIMKEFLEEKKRNPDLIDSEELNKKKIENANKLKFYETINELDTIYNKIIENNHEQVIYSSLKLKD